MGVGRAPSPAAFDLDFHLGLAPFNANRQNRNLKIKSKGGGRGRPPHTCPPGTLLINQFTTFYVFLPLIDTGHAWFDYVGCGLIEHDCPARDQDFRMKTKPRNERTRLLLTLELAVVSCPPRPW